MAKRYTAQGVVGDTLNIGSMDITFPRNTASVGFYSDAALQNPVTTGLTGTVTVTGIAQGNQTYTAFNNGTIDISVDGSFASAAAPITDVRAVPASVAGATHWQLTVTSNRS